ncbi:MAG: M23 family metallopeptidase [Bacteroidales bacterium]
MKKILLFLLTVCLGAPVLYGEEDKSPAPLDTLDTRDKFIKIVLFEDFTWKYIDLGKPVFDEEKMYEGWDSSGIHAFKDVPLEELPEEAVVILADSLTQAYVPTINKVRSKYSFRRVREHRGTDIALSTGDSIRSAFDGVVRVKEVTRNTGGYGNLLVIRHPNGLETYYGHLSRFLVDTGEVVKAGEVIGLGGNTGRSTGPHLHFETRYMGKAFDPERVFDFEQGTVRDSILVLKKHYFSIYSHYGQTDEESLAASQRIIHTIRSGDTLGALAIKYGTTVNQLCKWNGITPKTTLRIGRRLIVR